MKDKFSHKFVNSIAQIGHDAWQQFDIPLTPFCQYAFLQALEESHSVGVNTGWTPHHLVLYRHNKLCAVLPLYKKSHSYGEYVFDFAWANTYKQYGIHYYPKLVSAIPFTPVTGPRILCSKQEDLEQLFQTACQIISDTLRSKSLSSMHWLFVSQHDSQRLSDNQQLMRRSVQFQWFNRDYQDFEHFLQALNSRKRKSIRNERQKVVNAGVELERLHGSQLHARHMDFFYQCYQQTYLKRSGHHGYLTQAFFQQIFASMHDKLMIVIATRDGQAIASALFFVDEQHLYGRYWGALEEVDQLHFECCYYQGIEFSIEQGLRSFNPGTQGEHKILRGFEPIFCYSNHAMQELAFHDAISRFLSIEDRDIQQYKLEAEKLLPFRQN